MDRNLLTGDPERDGDLARQQLIDSLSLITPESPVNTFFYLGIVAILGDTETAKRLSRCLRTQTPLERYGSQFLSAMIAWCERRGEAAAGHLRTVATIVREYAIPLGEVSCLLGFAALAADDGDCETASRHLASIKGAGSYQFRTPLDILIYRGLAPPSERRWIGRPPNDAAPKARRPA